MFRLTRIPGNAVPDLSRYSMIMVAAILVMASLVSSVVEEAAFRGYFQGSLESHVGGPASVLIAALVIAPAHGLTQGFLWPTMLFYLLVDSMLGTLAYLSRSILPGIAVHAIGILIFFGFVWPVDKQRELIWQSGADTWFWIHVAQTVIFAILGILGFVRLARLTEYKSADMG